MLFDKQGSGDNICYTSIMLGVGWVLGVLLAVGIYLVGGLSTCHDMTVLTTVTDETQTSGGNLTLVQNLSAEVVECVIFDTAAAVCLTLGILLYPATLITIVVFRRRKDGDDICTEDQLGLSIVAAGVISGLLSGVGLVLQTAMDTSEATAGGAVLLIVVGITVWITLMCSKCYQQWREEQDEGHFM
jgi:hypothetical protein